MSSNVHTERAMRDIGDVVNRVQDDIARFKKVNWIIIGASHNICKRRGRIGHVRRQAIRHRLWRIAKRGHPILKMYVLPLNIEGDCPIKIKKSAQIPIRITRQKWIPRHYYHRNVPALIAGIIIGVFIVLIPIIRRKTLYEYILQFLNSFHPLSLNNFLSLISVFLLLLVFSLFLMNGLGYKPNQYSRYAGELSIVYFILNFFECVFFLENTNDVFVLGIAPISYWIAKFGVSSIGIVYFIFFETLDRDKRNRWKIVTFTIICVITLFLIRIFMPIIFS